MNETDWGQRAKFAAAIAVLIIAGRACRSKEGRYTPPDPMEYNNMDTYKRDRIEYDKNYEQDRRDYQAEHVQDNNW